MILANVFIALSLSALVVTILALRKDIPALIGGFLGAALSIVAAVNALEIFVISQGNQVELDPAYDMALILLLIFLINVIYIFDQAAGTFRN
jgi:hypothetical protein